MAAKKIFEQTGIPSEEELTSKFGGAVNLGRSVNEIYQNIVIGGDVAVGGKTVGDQVESLIKARRQTAPLDEADQATLPEVRLPKGLGVFLFSLDRYKSADPNQILQSAKGAGLGHVIVKIAQGAEPFPLDKEPLASIIMALKENKIEVWGLHYLLGQAPEKEAQVAVKLMSAYGCEGYLADIEIEFEKNFEPAKSAKLMKQFFTALRPPKKPRFPVGVVTFDSPSRHRAMPWKEMLAGCDFIAPMTVVGQQYNSGTQLSRSVVEFAEWREKNKLPHKPYVAVGLADAGKAAPTDLMEFIFTAKKLEVRSAVFSDWNYLFDQGERQGFLPKLAAEMSSITYTVEPGDTLSDIAQRFNLNLPDLVAANDIADQNLISAGMALKIPTDKMIAPAQLTPPEVEARPKGIARKGQKGKKAAPATVRKTKPPVEKAAAETPIAEPRKYPPLPKVAQPDVRRNYIQIIHNDEVDKVEDKLGFDKYAESFAQMVRDDRTVPPLAVGISGAWGSGKSFILKRIHDLLEPPKREGTKRNPLQRVWLWIKNSFTPQPKPKVYIVRFNAWDYNAYDAIWPGLVRRIFEALEKGNGPGRMAWSRFRRNLGRQWEGVKSKLIPWMAITAAIAILLYFQYGQEWQKLLGYILSIGVGTVITNVVTIISKPMAAWIINLVAEGRGYGSPTGYMEEIREDIDMLQQGLPPGTKIVVIIDDLDRCAAEKIVSTLEAIKLLLNFKIFIVFLAVDSSVIARAIEKQYKEIYAEAGRSGYFYLDKIIQIPFRIPEPKKDQVNNYLDALLTVANYSPEKTLDPQKVEQLYSGLARLKFLNGIQAEEFKKFAALLPDDAAGIQDVIKEVRYRLTPPKEGQIAIPQNLTGAATIWALLARWWPMSVYVMHDSLYSSFGEFDLDPSQPAFGILYDHLERRTEADVQVQTIRQHDGSDAMVAMLDKVLPNAPTFTLLELASVLQGWQTPYVSNIGFDRKESGAFKTLAEYLNKNPRHIKRLVNTFSLIRVLARSSAESETILTAPETTLRWLIISSQWPVTAQVMLEEFDNELQKRRTEQALPDDDDALRSFYERAKARFAEEANKALCAERDRLDSDPDTLENCIYANLGTLTSKRFEILRAYSINFNPAEDNLPLYAVRASQPTPQPAATQ